MVRLFSGFVVAVIVVLAAGLTGCGSGTSSTHFAIPGAIIVTPTGSVSMDLGTNQSFTATIHDFHGNVVAGEPVTWETSNASVVSVANNGLVCAGKWDSL